MQSAPQPRRDPAPRRAPLPTYVGGTKDPLVWAHFGSGEPVEAYRDRRRSYPGLVSCAPRTVPYYAALPDLFSGVARIVDVGCGSGEGAGLLVEHGGLGNVVGIDGDPCALQFARRFAPGATYLLSDLDSPPPIRDAGAAALVDVLGIAPRAATVLRSTRACLAPAARIVVAEPAAYATQHLVAPARRAFSRRSLASLLARSGYEIEAWLGEPSTFHCCVAHAADHDASKHLAEAEERMERGDAPGALEVLDRTATVASADVHLEAAVLEGRLAYGTGDGDRAACAYLRAREIDRGDPRAAAGLAMLALATGSVGDALRLAADALGLDPTDPDAAAAAALATEASGSDPLDAWRLVTALAPDDVGAASRLAQAAAARGDHSLAVSALERVRAYEDGLGAPLHVTLAWLLIESGRVEDAKLEARIARTAAPDDEGVAELCGHLGMA